MKARRQREGRRTSFAARRLVLLVLLVGLLVVPVVAAALNAFSSQSQSTQSPLVCSVAADPCQLPPSAVSP